MPDETPPQSLSLLDVTTPVDDSPQEVPVEVSETPAETPAETPPTSPKFSDFLKLRDDSRAEVEPTIKEHSRPAIPVEKPKEEAPKLEAPRREVKFAARNYTGLTPEEAKLFKNMSNEAYNELYPKYLDYKKLKAAPPPELPKSELPPTWYEHEDAVQLTPDFRRAAADRSRFAAEANHWREQIIKIREGEEGVSLTQDEEGNLQLGDKIEPSSRNEELIRERLAFVNNQLATIDNWMNGARTHFKQRFGDVKSRVRKVEASLFPFYEQPGNPHEAQIKQELESYPQELAGNMLAPLLAKFTVYSRALIARINALEKRNQVARVVKEDKAVAGPNQTDIGAASPPTKSAVSFSQMRGLTQD